jgi:hypothetical protein
MTMPRDVAIISSDSPWNGGQTDHEDDPEPALSDYMSHRSVIGVFLLIGRRSAPAPILEHVEIRDLGSDRHSLT